MKNEYYNLSEWKKFRRTGSPEKYCEFCRKKEELEKEELGKGM